VLGSVRRTSLEIFQVADPFCAGVEALEPQMADWLVQARFHLEQLLQLIVE
jgi:hypothetical protein